MNSPTDDMTQTATPGRQPEPAAEPGTAIPKLTKPQKFLVGGITGGMVTIAAVGFVGSYAAVTRLAARKGFGWFAYVFPTGVDAGILVYLALDLLLTWLRMPYGLLRQIAWALTAATIAFNAAAAWPDPLAVGMHAAIPILFIGAVEAARHTVGRIANIVADRHIESPPWYRWLLAFPSTFRIWRRMRLYNLRSYTQVIEQQRELKVYGAQLRQEYGRRWKKDAPADKLLPFDLAHFGISVSEALAMPETEAEARRKAEADREAEAKQKAEAKEAEARRKAEAEAETRRTEEAKRRAETEARKLAEAEAEAKLAEVARARTLAEAEAQAKLTEVERQRRITEAQAEADARRILDEQRQVAHEAELTRKREAEETARRTAEAEREAHRLAQERKQLADETLRKAEEHRRLEAQRRAEAEAASQPKPKPRTTTPKPETETAARPKPETEAKPKPTPLGGKRAQIETEVETLLGLMETEGYDAVDLKRAQEELGLKQTTAYDRLLKAQAKWAEQQAKAG